MLKYLVAEILIIFALGCASTQPKPFDYLNYALNYTAFHSGPDRELRVFVVAIHTADRTQLVVEYRKEIFLSSYPPDMNNDKKVDLYDWHLMLNKLGEQ